MKINSKINPNLIKERQSASFDVEEFAIWFAGDKQKLKEKREIVEEIFSDPEMIEDIAPDFLSYQDQYDQSVKKSTLLAKILKQIQDKREPGGSTIYPEYLTGALNAAVLPQGNHVFVHFMMFVPAIEKLGNAAQVAKWLPLAKNCKILGSYAQTELTHGTFIRGIQTRADYDATTEEFIINSPSITAYKWWAGSLGHTANYAIVVAQLYIKEKHHGIQMFLVQLRDAETHMPLPGIEIGDIGNKLGLKGLNNGFLGFKNVRIPRMQMMMRYAQVDADGTFTSSPAAVLSYLTMLHVRVLISKQSSMFLTLATTIATRFSAVRHQSLINPDEPEHQIIDHLTQQLKIFPEISKAIIFKLGADKLYEMYLETSDEIVNGKFDRLAEVHGLSACLKAITTNESSAGVEALRLACGGHGFLWASNFPTYYSLATAAATYEGENTILHLQTARFLMKSWSMMQRGEKLPPSVVYLEAASKEFPKWKGTLECIVRALQFASSNKIRLAYENMTRRKNNGMTREEAANQSSIELVQAADLHGRSFLATSALKKLSNISSISSSLQRVLLDVLELYLVQAFFRHMSDILRFIYLTEKDVSEMQRRLEEVLGRLRPNAVAIVDGFDHHDCILKSVLGSYDGNVYERIFESAQKSPLNVTPVHKSFHEYLKPFMNSNL